MISPPSTDAEARQLLSQQDPLLWDIYCYFRTAGKLGIRESWLRMQSKESIVGDPQVEFGERLNAIRGCLQEAYSEVQGLIPSTCAMHVSEILRATMQIVQELHVFGSHLKS